jgi:hypothetical protein
MATIPDDVLKLWSGSAGTGEAEAATESSTQAENNVSGLWWWVMLLLLAAALAESTLASRYLGTQREEL